jgi:hypothetical protein
MFTYQEKIFLLEPLGGTGAVALHTFAGRLRQFCR